MISGVTGWGMYVELPNTVEGLVHVSTLRGDYYVFSESTYELIGERTNRHFRLGGKGPYPGGGCRYPHEND